MTTGSRDYDRIERAISFLDSRAHERPSLDDVAVHVGLSPFHFQRLFQRWAGTTPKRFLQHATAEHATACLRDARTVLDTTLDVGLSGTGRLHDLLVSVCAMTPGEVRAGGAGLRIRWGVHDTPFGAARIALSSRGIVELAFAGGGADELAAKWPHAELVEDIVATAPSIERIFRRAAADGPLTLHLRGTNLQLRVWEALLRIPEGAVVSYGGLAAALDRPSAARAVAGAVAANPVAYVIPCHRVLRATGAIGGYRWGTLRKRVLLAREWSPGAAAVGER